ncbi:chaperone modulator CbpM [uncultured Imperialibacter sp.]|uniref:chaperone modulator CbpM n=1 Tax=uncultured Imperialibacter sp. TaxID=1672639 RepID=UPI0030D7B269|tara:strand:- start:1925 stop:2218 length:294 start_codon:yes stop_codon:yes gene_type:complete
MKTDTHIPIETLCEHYKVETTFFISLGEIGLIEIETIEQAQYVHEDQMNAVEKMIRMHHELDVNIEGIDVVFNLLNKIEALQTELNQVRSRLRLYED